MTAVSIVGRRGALWLPLIGVIALIATASRLALPALLGRAVDAAVAGTGAGRWITWVAVGVGVVVLTEVIDTVAATACVADTTAWLRGRLIRHLLAIGPARLREFDTGDLVTRVTSNAADAAQAGLSMVRLAVAVVPPIGSVVLLALIDPWLAGALLAGLTLAAVILRTFTRRSADVLSRYQTVQGQLAARLAESLGGARTIAAAGTLDQERRRVLAPLPELRTHGEVTWRVLARAGGQAAIIGPLIQVAVLGVGGMFLVDGRITAGDLLAASQYAAMGAALGGLTSVLSGLARARSGARRTTELLDLPPVPYGESDLPAGPGRLEFRGAAVHADGVPLLHPLDLVVPGGAAVAVVGPSGAGKSVLAALAGRLRDPDAGTVLLDGVPLPELQATALRTAVRCAFERPVLVGVTIADALGGPGDPPGVPAAGRATPAANGAVEAAARATRAHDFVSRLPAGYATPLATAPMSGGERQRLGLARAWTAQRLLVLDDATSSLDTVTEMQISRTLISDHGQRTRLIVTHRASTAARADLVVWLEAGRLRAVGPHDELWADPAYRAVFG